MFKLCKAIYPNINNLNLKSLSYNIAYTVFGFIKQKVLFVADFAICLNYGYNTGEVWISNIQEKHLRCRMHDISGRLP